MWEFFISVCSLDINIFYILMQFVSFFCSSNFSLEMDLVSHSIILKENDIEINMQKNKLASRGFVNVFGTHS